MYTVADIMSTDLLTLGPDDSLEDARKVMAQKHIRHIPIVDHDNQLVGIVSQRDVLAAADSALLSDADGHDSKSNYVALSAIMHTHILAAEDRTPLRAAALRLQQHKIGCLPVLHEKKLVGIVTESDYVALSINLLEQLEEEEPDELD